MQDPDTKQVAVGDCPKHGYVSGNEVEFNFPNKAKCFCGRELERCTVADIEEVSALAQ
jgi:hypothetical protein